MSEELKACPTCHGRRVVRDNIDALRSYPETMPCPDCASVEARLKMDPEFVENLTDRHDALRVIADKDATITALRAEVAGLREALEGLIDEDPCWYDHHGYCQAHFVTNPCEMAIAREALAKHGGV